MLAGLGALQFGMMYVLYIRSYAYLHPAQVALFTIFTPLLVTLFDDLLERRMSWVFLLTAALATVGTGICQYKGWEQGRLVTGFLMMQLSNGCFALGQVLYRRVVPTLGKKDHEIMGILYAGAAAVACVTAAGSVTAAKLTSITPAQTTILLYLGMIASGVGFFLFNAGARRVDIGTLAIFNNVKVPLAILCAALVFGDRSVLGWQLLAGGALIGAALWLNEILVRNRKQSEAEQPA
jgi:drug/metabolite transporter (DMT)-like permease